MKIALIGPKAHNLMVISKWLAEMAGLPLKMAGLNSVTDEDAADGFVCNELAVDILIQAIQGKCDHLESLAALEDVRRKIAGYDLILYVSPNNDTTYTELYRLFCDGVLINWLGEDWNEKFEYLEGESLDAKKESALTHYRRRYGFLHRFRASQYQPTP